jgi:beta-N-acetylhexosaminidase
VRRGGFGGVVLFARNIRDPEQLAELTSSLPGLLVAVDEEGGDVTRLEAAAGSSFPGNLALGVVDDVALTRRVAAAIGGELASVGVNFDLAPVADLIVDPANPIVGVRSFGSDPALVSRHVAAFVEGCRASPSRRARSTFLGTASRSPIRTLSSPPSRRTWRRCLRGRSRRLRPRSRRACGR